MRFDGSGGHAPPGTSSRTQPDGRSVYSVFPFRLGRWGIAPLRARPPYQPRRQVEPAERHVLHAVGVQQRRRVVHEHRLKARAGVVKPSAPWGYSCRLMNRSVSLYER